MLHSYGHEVTQVFERLLGRKASKEDLHWISKFKDLNKISDQELGSWIRQIITSEEFGERLKESAAYNDARAGKGTVYFNHLPKTSGLSLVASATQDFEPNGLVRRLNFSQFANLSQSELSRIRFISGHLGQTPLVQYPTHSWKMYGMWRNPTEWWVSSFFQAKRALANSLDAFSSSPEVLNASLSFSDWIRLAHHSDNSMLRIWMRVGATFNSSFKSESPEFMIEDQISPDAALKFVSKFSGISRSGNFLWLANLIRLDLGLDPTDRVSKVNEGNYRFQVSKSDVSYLQDRHPIDYWFDGVFSRWGDEWCQ